MKIRNYLLLLTLTACNNYYEHEYVYIPPEGAPARECILACNSKLQDCKKVANKAYQECLRNAEQSSMLNYNIDLNNKQISKINEERDVIEQCHTNSQDKCQQDYNSCYSDCGGKVEQNNYSSVNTN